MELDKDLQARQEARQLLRQAELAQKQLADFSQEQLDAMQVTCANLTVQYNGENHSNFSDPAAVKAFYDEIRSGTTATTAAANPPQSFFVSSSRFPPFFAKKKTSPQDSICNMQRNPMRGGI